jgi:hypothetical protein
MCCLQAVSCSGPVKCIEKRCYGPVADMVGNYNKGIEIWRAEGTPLVLGCLFHLK